MKRTIIFLVTLGGLIITTFIIGRVTNALQLFSTATTSNYPSIKVGSIFFASNLIKPKHFDFICYKAEVPEFGKSIFVHRLCGVEGDKIEIKQGNLYVNDKSIDENFTLAHNYILTHAELNKVKESEKIGEESIQELSKDTVLCYLRDDLVKTKVVKAVRQLLPKEHRDDFIYKQYSADWNQDNFGPITVPIGKYFVLGDNRLYSQDSRYLGFIDKSQYVATLLYNK